MKTSPANRSTRCYLSTLEHLSPPFRRWSIYTHKGQLTLAESTLIFAGTKKRPLTILLENILNLEIGSYPRCAKPLGLDYIELTASTEGAERTVLLTPNFGWAVPVWKTNIHVKAWYDALSRAMARAQEGEKLLSVDSASAGSAFSFSAPG